jgi:hypothetical protein
MPGSESVSFGPTGSGSVGQRYGSEFGFFQHQAKIVRKNLAFTFFDFFNFVKNDINVSSERSLRKGAGYGSVPKCHGSGQKITDPDPRGQKTYLPWDFRG